MLLSLPLLPPLQQVKCKFGAVVPGPGKVAVHAAAVMCDDRRAKAKHTVHLELRQDFFKPSTLGSCIRLRETQQVRDSVTGKADYEILSSGGIPQGGIEVCKSRAWSSVIRVGPLDAYAGEDCQGVTFRSMVVGAPSSGYQERLKSEGVVDVHTKNCQRDYDNSSDDSEEDEADGKVRAHGECAVKTAQLTAAAAAVLTRVARQPFPKPRHVASAAQTVTCCRQLQHCIEACSLLCMLPLFAPLLFAPPFTWRHFVGAGRA